MRGIHRGTRTFLSERHDRTAVTATGEMTVRTMSTSRKPPAELVVAE